MNVGRTLPAHALRCGPAAGEVRGFARIARIGPLWWNHGYPCYNSNMATQEAIIDELLEPLAEALTPETARLFVDLKAAPSVQARIDVLAMKCNEGNLTEQERADYENYIRIGNLFALIKAKAKRVIAESSHE
jgi:hypothetical protein